MRVQVLDKAEKDLADAYWFYEAKQPGLGAYFRESIYADLDALEQTAGIHRIAYRHYHRALTKRFPFALYYSVEQDTASVHAIVDCRRDPTWIREHLE
jgi:hypothetical protein